MVFLRLDCDFGGDSLITTVLYLFFNMTEVVDIGDNGELEIKILEFAKTKPEGISNKDVQNLIPDTPAQVWTTVINKLLKHG